MVLLSGTATLAGTAALLAVLHLLYAPLIIIALGLWACIGALSCYRKPPFKTPGSLELLLPWLFVIALAGGLSLAASTTFAPFYDQWHYHLGFPYHWLREGTITTFPRQAYSFFPSNMGLLYTYALAGPGGWAAQTVHWWMGLLTAAGSAAVAQRIGAPVSGRAVAAAGFLATPTVVQMGALAGSDLGVAAVRVGAVLAVLRLASGPGRAKSLAAMAGLLMGCAAGCKYTALYSVVPPLALMVLFMISAVTDPASKRSAMVRTFVVFGLAFALTLAPWLIRNMVATGNPVAPYFERLFSVERGSHQGTDEDVASGIGGFGLSSDKVVIGLTLGTFNRRGQIGDLGPVYLLFVVPVLVWSWRNRKTRTAPATLGFVFLAVPLWALGPPLGRYLLPIIAVFAGLIGAVWADLQSRYRAPIRGTLTAVLILILIANCNPTRGEYLMDQFRCFLGSEVSEQYLEANLTQIAGFRAMNATLPESATVLLVGEPRPYGLDRDVIVEDPFRRPLLVELADSSSTPGEIGRRLREMGVTHIFWNATEAARIAEGEGRQRYLACRDERSQERLDRFLLQFTAPVEGGGSWEIAALTLP